MQLLSSIADLKDIVNKEYIDSILADYVLSANLGALATKDSLAFSDLTSRPSKLSDFTDDVVAGNYLPLSGGTLTGGLTISSGNLIISASGGGDTVTNKIYPTADDTYSLGQNGRRWSDIKTVLINGGTPIHSGNIGSQSVASAESAKVISDYSNSRITSADVEVFGDSGVRKFIASSYMTSGKPPRDGSILHFSWDTTSGYEHQLFIANGKSATPEQRMAWRTQDAGVWGDWKTVAFTDSTVSNATKFDNKASTKFIYNELGESVTGTTDVDASSYQTLTRTQFFRDNSISSIGFIALHSSADTYGFALYNQGYEVDNLMFRRKTAGSWVAEKTIAFTDSNVASATKLATARTIWGQSFDGTGNVSGTLKNVSWIELTGTNFGIYQGSALNSALTDNDIALYSQKVYMSGNVGIGTANPAYRLDVAGSIRTTSSLTIGTIVLTDENGTLKIAGNVYTTGQLATGEAGHATSGGGSVQYWSNEYDMNIGTDVLVSSKEYIGTNTIVGWDLAGTCINDLYIGYDGYTIWMQGSVDEASDMRLKTVIDAVNLDIRDIAFAPIFNYVFKSRPQGRQMLGSSAQYWQTIAPCAVSENDKGNLAMNYGAVALASVVAVAKKTLTHEEEIANLKLEVQDLKQRLAKYELN